MAEHVWSVLCAKPLIEPGSNMISLFEVAEKLNLHAASHEVVEQELERVRRQGLRGIFAPVHLNFVSWWVRSDYSVPETSSARVTVRSPAGEILLDEITSVDLESLTGQRHLMEIDQFRVPMLGLYWFVVEKPKTKGKKTQWERVARIPFEVAVRPTERPPTVSTAQAQPSEPTPAAPPESSSPPEPSRPSRRRASPKRQRPGSSPRRGPRAGARR